MHEAVFTAQIPECSSNRSTQIDSQLAVFIQWRRIVNLIVNYSRKDFFLKRIKELRIKFKEFSEFNECLNSAYEKISKFLFLHKNFYHLKRRIFFVRQ